MRGGVLAILTLLGSAAVAAADEANHDQVLAGAIREFNFILLGRSDGSIDSVRDRIVAHLKDGSPKVAKSIRFQLDRGFTPKYQASLHVQTCIAQMLASGGTQGIAKLFQRYKASMKRDDLREAIADALGGCGDDQALETLLKVMYDKEPKVAAAAIRGAANYAKVPPDRRKAAMRAIIDRYSRVTDAAAGKEADAPPMLLYKAVKAVVDDALKAFSGGESLDSAIAWDAWLRENMTAKWPE
jgi:hypothetical protein